MHDSREKQKKGLQSENEKRDAFGLEKTSLSGRWRSKNRFRCRFISGMLSLKCSIVIVV